jgi:hypothetical protein
LEEYWWAVEQADCLLELGLAEEQDALESPRAQEKRAVEKLDYLPEALALVGSKDCWWASYRWVIEQADCSPEAVPLAGLEPDLVEEQVSMALLQLVGAVQNCLGEWWKGSWENYPDYLPEHLRGHYLRDCCLGYYWGYCWDY